MTRYYQCKAARASSHGLAGRPSNNARPCTLVYRGAVAVVDSLSAAVQRFAASSADRAMVFDRDPDHAARRLTRGPRGGILIERVS